MKDAKSTVRIPGRPFLGTDSLVPGKVLEFKGRANFQAVCNGRHSAAVLETVKEEMELADAVCCINTF